MNKLLQTKYFLLFFLISFVGCKQKEEVAKVKIEHYSSKELVDLLSKNEFQFTSISAKAEIEYTEEKSTSFKAHLRIQKDSIIWISITPVLGIEIARVMITQDSVMLMNRVKSEYFKGDFDYINKMFNVEFDYEMLQSLLIGNSLEFEDNEKLRTSIDRKSDRYFIGTEKKRKVKKDLKKEKEKIKEQSQVIWLEPKTFKIVELLVLDPNKDQSLNAIFSDHRILNEQLFPFKLVFNIRSKKELKINVDYSKITLDKEQSYSFKIPSKYEQIQ
tara:strand:- start:623 stop:1441 length:819 start_codon:yes stop_codon:yes gene_type:complete